MAYLFAQSSAEDVAYAEVAEAMESDTGVSEDQAEILDEDWFVDAVVVEDGTVPVLDAMTSDEPMHTTKQTSVRVSCISYYFFIRF